MFLWLFGCALAVVAAQAPGGRPTIDQALRLAAGGRLDESEQLFLALERAHPGDPEVQYRFGLVLLKKGKLADARHRLESAAKLDPQSPFVWLALAQVRLRLDDAAGTLAAADRARSGRSSQPALVQALAMLDAQLIDYHIRKGPGQQAVDLAKKAIARSDAAVFHNLLGRAHERNNDPVAAAEELQRAIRLDPDQANYYLDLAQLFLDHNTPEPAEVVLGSAAQRFPQNAEVLRLLGVARYALGKTPEAVEAFLKAIDAAPDLESAYASLETLLPAAQSRLAEITLKLRRFSERQPSSPVGPYLLALIVPEESEGLLQKAIRAASDFWPAYYELHKLLKAQEKWEESAAALNKTIELNPDFAPAHYALAEYYNRIGDRTGAARQRELHHKLLTEQREAAEKHHREAPRLAYTLSER